MLCSPQCCTQQKFNLKIPQQLLLWLKNIFQKSTQSEKITEMSTINSHIFLIAISTDSSFMHAVELENIHFYVLNM